MNSTGIPRDAKQAAVIRHSQWYWPPSRSAAMLEIQTLICDNISPKDTDDQAY